MTVVELASSAVEGESGFGRARSCLRALLASNTVIEWILPDELLHMAFAWLQANIKFIEERIESLKGVAEGIVVSPTLAEFLNSENALGRPFPSDYWRTFDIEFGRGHIDATGVGTKRIRDVFERVKRGDAKSDLLGEAVSKMEWPEFCRWFVTAQAVLNRSATVHALAARARASFQAAPENLGDSYDGTIDAFVDAFSLRAMLEHGQLRTPGRNDALDLAHFLYLKRGMLLATGDKKMNETAAAIGIGVHAPSDLLTPSPRCPSREPAPGG